jgi:CRP-like cAMP-binding protein
MRIQSLNLASAAGHTRGFPGKGAGMDQNQVRRSYGGGETIFSQGDQPDVVYVVRSGAVKIFRSQDGKPTTLGVLKPGDMFGEMAVFGRKPRSASAEAVGATECTLVGAEEFKEIVGGPEVWKLLEKMSQRIREVDEQIEKLNLEQLGRQSALSTIRLRRSSFE